MSSYGLCEAPADKARTQQKECFVDGGQSLISDSQTTELMQPRDGAFHYPARLAQAATMRRIPTCNLCAYALHSQFSSERLGLIGAIGLDDLWFTLGRTAQAGNRRNRPNQRQQLRDIMLVSAGQDQRKRDTLRICEDVVFAARTTAIGWVRSTFFPAPTARIEELSATTREKSSCLAPRSCDSSTWCSCRHTPQRCQYFSRLQHVIPDPQPISFGSISHGMPERNTNRMPLSTARSSSGSRPLWRLRLRFFGNNGSMRIHKSSSINGFGILVSPDYTMPNPINTVIKVQASFC